jgi:hypothetical protein
MALPVHGRVAANAGNVIFRNDLGRQGTVAPILLHEELPGDGLVVFGRHEWYSFQ